MCAPQLCSSQDFKWVHNPQKDRSCVNQTSLWVSKIWFVRVKRDADLHAHHTWSASKFHHLILSFLLLIASSCQMVSHNKSDCQWCKKVHGEHYTTSLLRYILCTSEKLTHVYSIVGRSFKSFLCGNLLLFCKPGLRFGTNSCSSWSMWLFL